MTKVPRDWLGWAGLCALVTVALPAPAAEYAVRWVTVSPVHVEVAGLRGQTLEALRHEDWSKEQWERLLDVRTDPGTQDVALPAMAGEYQVDQHLLRFVPRFPPVPGVRYVATFHSAALPGNRAGQGLVLRTAYAAPSAATGAVTVVTRVYPTASLLPENQLKFYLHFSAPMSRGQIYDHIHLREESGREVELPFLQIDEELWNPELTRLTLLIDPGRIKRGVRPLEEVGPALVEGKRYTLVIDPDWLDAQRRPLGKSYQKRFLVGPPDRSPPDPRDWQIQAPPGRSREPLRVAFPDPMDHALSLRMIGVIDAAGQAVRGESEMEDEERRWTFRPQHPWRPGPHQLVVATTIEDLAGNNIGKPFEVDLFQGIQRHLDSSSVKIPFLVPPP